MHGNAVTWVTDGEASPGEPPDSVMFLLGMASLRVVCIVLSCHRTARQGAATPPHLPGAARTSRLPHSKAKSLLHASVPIICCFQGREPSWKPCPPAHPSSSVDHKGHQVSPEGRETTPEHHPASQPQDRLLQALVTQGTQIFGTTALLPGGWGTAGQGQASWGCLPTPTHAPAPHQPHAGHLTLMVFPSANKLLTWAILWANCCSCE